MLGNRIFFNDLMSKYTALFGNLFNDISINRVDQNGVDVQGFQIPLGYGPRDKWLARVEEDPDANRPYAARMPRMAFDIQGFEYDGARKLGTTLSYKQEATVNGKKVAISQVNSAVPYTITFKLVIMAKTAQDAHRIQNQIIPYFTPTWTVSAKLLDEMPDFSIDIPITLTSCEYFDEYEGNFEKRRVVGWNMLFTMKAYFFGPVKEAKVIKVARVNFNTTTDQKNPDVTITTQPGLTANGEPTTDILNTIPPYEIDENDKYGYIVTIEENI